MKDLTQGPITRQLVAMAVPIAIGMLFQTLYFLVDRYFVSHLGDAAIAGVGSAGVFQLLQAGFQQNMVFAGAFATAAVLIGLVIAYAVSRTIVITSAELEPAERPHHRGAANESRGAVRRRRADDPVP